ncbi:hypothetical protein [Dyadobacter bucti]|uniref:hypothetical protein n=1 Tax=Dyadobacter bucti TaxID=2572203 RepID=UPI001108BD81|nr:hypothetical protein [Dyadobacter bucti]
MKVFVFFIGGTGARVMRSLTMLLASGASVPNDTTIIPILLDMDLQNGDVHRAVDSLELYERIHRMAYGSLSKESSSFFGGNFQLISSLQANNTQNNMVGSVLSEITSHSGTFESYLQVDAMDEMDREFLKLLYDNSAKPQQAELKLNLSVGFKGNPNIGSVVFSAFEDSAIYQYFSAAFNSINDRIFIVSSIFGGTGSSGYPQLVKLLQKPAQRNEIRAAKKGAVTVMPYFSLGKNTQSAIDQKRFIPKTKAALSYYQNQLDLDATYFIGDQAGSKLYPNVEGGGNQLNNAHIVEMLAAEAVLDFARKTEFPSNKKFLEFGLQKGEKTLDFRHFHDNTFQAIMLPLLRFSYAMKLVLDHIGKPEVYAKQAFAVKELRLQDEWNSSSFYSSLKVFAEFYKKWIRELQENDRSFHPFELDNAFNEMVNAKKVKTNKLIFNYGIDDSFLNTKLGHAEEALRAQFPNKEQRFMQILYQVANDCVKELGDIPRNI